MRYPDNRAMHAKEKQEGHGRRGDQIDVDCIGADARTAARRELFQKRKVDRVAERQR